MRWARLDADVLTDPRFDLAGASATACWMRGLAYCARHNTDGKIPREALIIMRARSRDARALVEHGLWTEAESGWQMSWEDQATKAEADAEKAAWREKKARQRGGNVPRGTLVGTPHETPHGSPQGSPADIQDKTVQDSTGEKINPHLPLVGGPPSGRPHFPATAAALAAELAGELVMAPRAKKQKPLTTLPDPFEPSEANVALATERGLDLRHEVESFKAWHAAKGNVFKDWQMALRTWLLRANPRGATLPPRQGAAKAAAQLTMTDDEFEDARALDAKRRASGDAIIAAMSLAERKRKGLLGWKPYVHIDVQAELRRYASMTHEEIEAERQEKLRKEDAEKLELERQLAELERQERLERTG